MVLTQKELSFIDSHTEEAKELLKTLGRIPAPSGCEEKRAGFCLEWLKKQGAREAYIDEAKNVVCYFPGKGAGDEPLEELTVVMAHTDVVFADQNELPMEERDGRLYCPGIGDDTANVVNLLMAAKYLLRREVTLSCGLLLVCNASEEGLGGLKGCRQIMNDFAGRIKQMISFDLYTGMCINEAVGCCRYRVTVKTKGGHSFNDFGISNAIVCLAELIGELDRVKLPDSGKTTYNIGRISGGTSVNTIAAEASMLYEYRSTSAESLDRMREYFRQVEKEARKRWEPEGVKIETTVIDRRPCSREVNKEKLNALTEQNCAIIRRYYNGAVTVLANSTDANLPLSLGIPANTIGTIVGEGAHTRGEWIELDSIGQGIKIALEVILTAADALPL